MPNNMIFDSHIHLDQYSPAEIQKIFQQLEHPTLAGLIAVSTDLRSAQKLLKLKQQQAKLHIAAGFHPEQPLQDCTPLLDWIAQHHQQLIAIGEVGLPQYTKRQNPQLDYLPYVDLLEQFIRCAKKYQLPIVLHAVYADSQLALDLLMKHNIEKAHFHWFKGEPEQLQALLKTPYMLSLCPDILHNPKTQAVADYFPLSRLMIETDGPWQHVNFEPSNITRQLQAVIKKLAEIKDFPTSLVEKQLAENTKDFYQLSV